ncbi:hypothetical protein ACHAW5_005674 [Stephanodiscus triporus]|uniref:Uncharacterized protein n=1 Tax=Stephanodiscus triporus TaxID=2934178 RepID=A0ABD3NUQ6_9STRA
MDGRRRGRRGRGRGEHLTPRTVSLVLSFLDEALPGRPELQARVLRNTPRILGSRTRRVLSRAVIGQPTLLHLNVETNLMPTANFLRDACDLSDRELAALISANPGVLGLSVSRNLAPTIGFLRDVLARDGRGGGGGGGEGGEDESRASSSLRRCTLRHPQILSLSLENLRAKRDYFDGIDRLDEPSPSGDDDVGGRGGTRKPAASLAARILATAPSTYSLSLTENIIPKVEYLAGLWGVDRSARIDGRGGRNSLSDNLREYPQVLTLSKDGNIVPTLSFFNMTGYVRLDANGAVQVRESSTQQPKPVIRSRYIATSLYNRLLPRWHFLVEERERHGTKSRIHSNSEEVRRDTYACIMPAPSTSSSSPDSAPPPPLHLLAGANDEVFCREMNLPLAEYLEFKKMAIPRLKFASQFDRWLKTGQPID